MSWKAEVISLVPSGDRLEVSVRLTHASETFVHSFQTDGTTASLTDQVKAVIRARDFRRAKPELTPGMVLNLHEVAVGPIAEQAIVTQASELSVDDLRKRDFLAALRMSRQQAKYDALPTDLKAQCDVAWIGEL